MKGELGIARCGLACCLCSENTNCAGCNSGECPGKDWCENRKCSLEKGIGHCYACDEDCRKGLLTKVKPYIMNMYTNPAYRRRGVAYKTLDKLIKDAQNRGITAISLEATDLGRLLYENYGFVKLYNEMELPE